ncbi:DUF805 domain-containing protein [Chryseobacterium sp. GMJ5]|uniref:DUF805 domain-containing protein n=1 Tax=Chryseobacterium gilvum TaxID=2976534 RepID=A0ABT2VYS9_9FLAO|nr:DUF805 domain-containing protein [Chryseobacterium gilvum]MCU7615142.1 DUF805 domain-containing protein [Chryseobacterium gilvum]
MFQNVFSNSGRITRTEFALTYVIYIAALFFTIILAAITRFSLFYLITMFVWFAGQVFRIIQGAKRCHDLGNSGWFQFIPFYIIIMAFVDGDPGRNRYGDNPKGNKNYYTIDEIGKREY